jgi:hypothetical protein
MAFLLQPKWNLALDLTNLFKFSSRIDEIKTSKPSLILFFILAVPQKNKIAKMQKFPTKENTGYG